MDVVFFDEVGSVRRSDRLGRDSAEPMRPVEPLMTGRFAARFSLGLVLAGIALLLVELLRDRSLWLDESLLALNILGRSPSALLEPLDYQQGAPAGFLLLQKLMVSLFGDSERALRLVPLIAGMGALFGFRRLALDRLDAVTAVLASGLFALSAPVVYFATEAKPYSVDVAVTVWLLLGWTRFAARAPSVRATAMLGFAGATAVWLSHPSVFVLAGIGVAGVTACVASGDRRRLAALLGAGPLWAASFAACWAIHLRHLVSNEFLTHFWRRSFLPGPFALDWIVESFALPYLSYLALTPWGLLTALLAVVGALRLAIRDRSLVVVTAAATAVMLFASMKSIYPAFERLLMFLAPLVVMLVGGGAGAVVVWLSTRLRILAAAAVAVFLAWPTYGALELLAAPRQVQEIKPVLEFIKSHEQPSDVIYIFHLAAYPFKYYAARYGFNDAFDPADYVNPELKRAYADGRPRVFERDGYSTLVMGYTSFFTTEKPEDVRDDLAILAGRPRVWILLSHSTGGNDARQMILDRLDSLGTRTLSLRKPGRWGGSEVHLYDLSSASHEGRG